MLSTPAFCERPDMRSEEQEPAHIDLRVERRRGPAPVRYSPTVQKAIAALLLALTAAVATVSGAVSARLLR